MADAYGLIWPGDEELLTVFTPGADLQDQVERYKLRKVPLVIETAKNRHADDLHEVLKDLAAMAKMAVAAQNTYQAALRNAEELLKQIDRESTEEMSDVQGAE
ncbi:hypothetical protein GCM10011533_30080 [Streptosporangium jomthongense]|uniref:Uncharacterized protein n=1 Tax=Marinobacter aromaticivorans TaxID=1494078 RepID=A0ABW2IZ24_9GAMM|nr:hypothetical protein [Marinobacter aromaticivorans]GGE75718.1 hypothetical protein GCM10011533_30080 [Streptosporangium jomthongense]